MMTISNKIENFLRDINKKGEVQYFQISEKLRTIITKEQAFSNKKDNIYFLWGTSWLWKCKDCDIENVSYLRVDIDITNNCKKLYWIDTTEEDLAQAIIELRDMLEWTEFENWRYIVNSGRWAHLYFCWTNINILAECFSLWMKHLLKKFYSIFDWRAHHFIPDYACSNIARIMRLPWTINQRNWKECKIIFNQDKKFDINIIKQYAEIEKERIEKKRREEEKKFLSKSKNYNETELYKEINNIPAYIIAQRIIPQFPFNRNWKNFDNEKGWYTAYFYCKNSNLICNWGSRHFNWGTSESKYNNFSLIKNSYNFTNWETFNYFKDLLWHQR